MAQARLQKYHLIFIHFWFRNALGSFITRVILLTFLPLTRHEIIRILSNFSFRLYKNAVMSENFLLARISR